MAHTLSLNPIIGRFLSLSLPKQTRKPDYTAIRDTHCLLTANAESIKIPLGGGKNGHLRLFLMATQYTFVSPAPFFCLTDPGRMPTIPSWTAPFEEKNPSVSTRKPSPVQKVQGGGHRPPQPDTQVFQRHVLLPSQERIHRILVHPHNQPDRLHLQHIWELPGNHPLKNI